jgi:hypothetical protein
MRMAAGDCEIGIERRLEDRRSGVDGGVTAM